MGIAIAGGAGILLGIGLMIWALKERSARHKAERSADQAENERKAFAKVAEDNARIAQEAEDQANRLKEQVEVLRKRVDEARALLIKAGNPKAIKEWLDSELKAEEL